MKAEEVLRRYAAGERDFRRVNLRGQSFKGKDLSGADFSEADIRGANFTNAYLKDAKFCGVKAGLKKRWRTGLIIFSLLLLIGAEYLLQSLAGTIVSPLILSIVNPYIFFNNLNNSYNPYSATAYSATLGTLLSLSIITVLWIITIRKGFNKGVVAVAVFGSTSVSFILYITNIFALRGTATAPTSGFVTNSIGLIINFLISNTASVIFPVIPIAGIIIFAETVIGAVAGVGAIIFSVVFAAAFPTVTYLFWFFFWLKTTAVSGAISVPNFPDYSPYPIITINGVIFAVIVVFTLPCAYISWRALEGDEKYALMRTATVAFAAMGGTSFRRANLTDADFFQATLKSTDFRGANLTRTNWKNVKKLDHIRPGTTYLQNPKVRQLLITGQGQDQNFDRQNLRGVNLQGANLVDSSFIGADLSEANLQDADLSRAKLVQTQLDEADLTGVTLTGATIEDWNITSHTKLQGIRCRYVFMRLPTKDNPEPRRKPDNREEEFEDGDFADFIKPIVDTLDLYHNQGVDPRAIAISFKQLAENNPEAELEIVAMEKRGQDKFLLRASTAPNSDRSALSAEYFTKYNELKALTEQQKAVLAEKDSRISSLENMVETALQRQSFYAQTYNNQGDTMSNAPKKITKNDLRGASFAGGFVDADTVYAEQIGGNINNYPAEQKQNLADAAAEIQQLLQQLEQTYPDATEFEKQSALAITLQQEIKQNPTFKARLKNALKEGGIEALKVLFAPIGIPIEMVRGWIEAEAE
ncbi:MAG: pentapeptide repeat-containing protein [Coleofasciculaceae cyanobacterium]